MVHYKLTYFDARGIAECTRQLFALAEQPYEDCRLSKEAFSQLKPDLPFGQVPILEVDGQQLAQSLAINRYLARQFAPSAPYWPPGPLIGELIGVPKSLLEPEHRLFTLDFTGYDNSTGFAGKSPFEEAVIDSLADQYNDYRNEIKPYFYASIGVREGDVEQLKKDVLLPARDKFLGFITKLLKKNADHGFLVGDKMSWVDVLIAEHMADITNKVPEFLDGFPEVKEHMEKIQSDPKIRKWIETRPQTSF